MPRIGIGIDDLRRFKVGECNEEGVVLVDQGDDGRFVVGRLSGHGGRNG